MAWYNDFSFWAMLAKNVGAAGNLACLIGIVIFGSAVLEDYDTFGCNIGAGTNDEGHDPHSYKLATQLLFIFTIVASFLYAPHNHKNVQWQYAFAVLLSMGLVISAFLAGYAGITTNCSSSGFVNASLAKLGVNSSSGLTTGVIETMETSGSKSMAASFLSFGAVLGLASHDLFDKRGDIHFAISHWPSWLDTIMRIIAFSLIAHFLNDDANYTPDIANMPSAQCMTELDKLKDSDHGDIIPYKHNGMYKLALSAAIITGIECTFKIIELMWHTIDKTSSSVTKFAMFNRVLTVFSRICVGIFVFGFILANELLICQPYEINSYFKAMTGMLLACYFSGVLQTMLVGHGNILVIFGEGPSKKVADNTFSNEMGLNSNSETQNPLLMGF